ncbi:hypothetical protein EDI_051090 [Entamoeba dispar SAW760]|uniref:Uncharacterized protein n=1 Tax=Entamoeba dispar (strain ATCC PRA-260 / SAW760) TaxID=370354 RepID=B0ES92_ENTDS|nr:uncharacterized protein EDI_051090 [Entamoeba dispar SAW760]EDR22595.1 hypothetical protein EDI_051090 [Entamoeba dispar SAW760]|eukprot:EDR22595.1 hypothetical protein EDI_051090 [Entamoeba dispar SAW760]
MCTSNETVKQIQYGNVVNVCGEVICYCVIPSQQNYLFQVPNYIVESQRIPLTGVYLIRSNQCQNATRIKQYNNLKSKEKELIKRAYTVSFLSWSLLSCGCEVQLQKCKKRSTKINPFVIEHVIHNGEIIFDIEIFKSHIDAQLSRQTIVNAMNYELISLLKQFGCEINYKTRGKSKYPLITITSYSLQGITHYDWEIIGKKYYYKLKQQI